MKRPTVVKLPEIVEHHVLNSAGSKMEAENYIQDSGGGHIEFA